MIQQMKIPFLDFADSHGDAQPQGRSGWPLGALAGGHELHFAIEVTPAGHRRINQRKFAFVGLRRTAFSDGHCIVGWCTDPACPDAASHAPEVLSGSEFPHQSQAAFFEGQLSICHPASQLEQAWGSWQGQQLQQMRTLQTAAGAQPQQARSHTFTYGSVNASGVQPQAEDFSSWAVLLPHSNGAGYFCTSCDASHTCQHMAASGVTGGSGFCNLGFRVKVQGLGFGLLGFGVWVLGLLRVWWACLMSGMLLCIQECQARCPDACAPAQMNGCQLVARSSCCHCKVAATLVGIQELGQSRWQSRCRCLARAAADRPATGCAVTSALP